VADPKNSRGRGEEGDRSIKNERVSAQALAGVTAYSLARRRTTADALLNENTFVTYRKMVRNEYVVRAWRHKHV